MTPALRALEARLRELLAKATPLPREPVANMAGEWFIGRIRDHVASPLRSKSEAELACEAVNALPALLDALATAREGALAEAAAVCDARANESAAAAHAETDRVRRAQLGCDALGARRCQQRILALKAGPSDPTRAP